MRVLIADDELRLRKVVALHLKKSGLDVIEVSNGRQAIEKAKECKPDVIVLDVMMPEMNGLEALSHIKSDNMLKNIPVIMLSAKATGEDIEKGMALGAACYLTKPFSPKQLLDEINKLGVKL
ncbi:MAG: two-component system, OmpR family, alkaline phosphatase synthesis response regulator PhoP [Deferribacteres bacterium]|jgi:CheY-like chemotaxis protein|nr:response regulator [Deferribacteraceae bacterium]MDK2791771.1 two-component system, OmpR family, alkaline phosphatase synthesis response regulator PhoP [Deferribacteres bacterium]